MRDTIIDLLRAHIFVHVHMGERENVCCVHAGAGVGASASASSGAMEKPCTLKVCLRGS
jgi:hypothetical protein